MAADRHGRRYTFANWMKRLANLRGMGVADAHASSSNRRHNLHRPKKRPSAQNNPYPLSGTAASSTDDENGHLSFSEPLVRMASSEPSLVESVGVLSSGSGSRSRSRSGTGRASYAPTVRSTTGDTAYSEAQSKSGTAFTTFTTTQTAGRSTQYGGEGSTFSSPSPSVRSLTTTLTTMQSANTGNALVPAAPSIHHHHHHHHAHHHHHVQSYGVSSQQIGSHFVHPFASTVPQGGNGSSGGAAGPPQPTTYSSATANNMLTDNASILTLASSSKQPRRRNSLDTNASIRALPPSSMFSNSRESLPLSVLSEMVGAGAGSGPGMLQNTAGPLVLVDSPPRSPEFTTMTPSSPGRHSSDLAALERRSVYSSTGMTDVAVGVGVGVGVASDRAPYNPHHHRLTTDAASVRSGRARHVRSESSPSSLDAHVSSTSLRSGSSPSAGVCASAAPPLQASASTPASGPQHATHNS
ncbi:hypothetical protein KEM52_000545 [Ascosphaera acerosa]|nr:hypothetical protein KEM52_000545 [Ascosphaera acerosa]